ncbi:hypothetical protein TNCT_210181 [Trichonephila clavata]|uniref:Uncharacterized protein n=1 Tax=Trichonephila clavata TaxID=2740835 RepID=A0A8X6GYI4_TRICU|nr:hypothetical protein TNCT_210181 [Trichonephila clavata]
MTLQFINDILPDALTIYTDGSKFEDGRAKSLPPEDDWHVDNRPTLLLSCSGPRSLQFALARLRNEYLRPMKFQNGENIPPLRVLVPSVPAIQIPMLVWEASVGI